MYFVSDSFCFLVFRPELRFGVQGNARTNSLCQRWLLGAISPESFDVCSPNIMAVVSRGSDSSSVIDNRGTIYIYIYVYI